MLSPTSIRRHPTSAISRPEKGLISSNIIPTNNPNISDCLIDFVQSPLIETSNRETDHMLGIKSPESFHDFQFVEQFFDNFFNRVEKILKKKDELQSLLIKDKKCKVSSNQKTETIFTRDVSIQTELAPQFILKESNQQPDNQATNNSGYCTPFRVSNKSLFCFILIINSFCISDESPKKSSDA